MTCCSRTRCVDPGRLAAMASLADARVTVAVDSEATIDAAARTGIAEVLIDVNVGLPRCGCDPDDAGRLADLARSRGLTVRGVMGYEGQVMPVVDRADRAAQVEESMAKLRAAHEGVGGDVTSAGGTGTYDLHRWASEIQCGSLRAHGHVLRAARPPVSAGPRRVGDGDLGVPEVDGVRRRPQVARHGSRRPVDRRRQGVVLLRRAHDVRAGSRRPARPTPRRRPRRGSCRLMWIRQWHCTIACTSDAVTK